MTREAGSPICLPFRIAASRNSGKSQWRAIFAAGAKFRTFFREMRDELGQIKRDTPDTQIPPNDRVTWGPSDFL